MSSLAFVRTELEQAGLEIGVGTVSDSVTVDFELFCFDNHAIVLVCPHQDNSCDYGYFFMGD